MKLVHGADGVNAGDVAATNGLPVAVVTATASGTITTQNLVPAGTATAGSAVEITLNGAASLAIQVTGTYTGSLSLQASLDGSNWVTVAGGSGSPLFNINTTGYVSNIVSGTTGVWQADVAGYVKARVSAVVGAVTGTATVSLSATQAAGMVSLNGPLPTGSAVIGALTANQSVNAVQIAGTTASTGNGVAGAGVLRVAIASDNTAFAINLAGRTTGGATSYTLISAATTNATSVKASAGTLLAIHATNTGAAVAFLKLYNKASAPTVGTDTAVKTILIPATSGSVSVYLPTIGEAYSAGIALAITGVATTADTTAVAAAQVVVNLDYV